MVEYFLIVFIENPILNTVWKSAFMSCLKLKLVNIVP